MGQRKNKMEQDCKVCKCQTDFPNGICAQCWNLGMRGLTQDGNVIMDKNSVVNYMRKNRGIHAEHAEFYDRLFKTG